MIVLFKKEDLHKSGHSVKLGIPVMEKLEILKLSAEVAEKESGRSWARFSVMLYASIGLLAVLVITFRNDIFWANMIPPLIGIVLSVAWLKMNALSSYYAERWHADMAAIIASDKTLRESVKEGDLSEIQNASYGKGAPFYFNIVPGAFLGLWLLIFVAVIWAGLWRPPSESVKAADPAASQASVDARAPTRAGNQDGHTIPQEQAGAEPVGPEEPKGGQVYVDSRALSSQKQDPGKNKPAGTQSKMEKAQPEAQKKTPEPRPGPKPESGTPF